MKRMFGIFINSYIAEQLNQNSEICHLMKMIIEDKTKKTYNLALGMLNREIYGTDLKEINNISMLCRESAKTAENETKRTVFRGDRGFAVADYP